MSPEDVVAVQRASVRGARQGRAEVGIKSSKVKVATPDTALCDKPSTAEASMGERTLKRRQGLYMRTCAKATAEFEVAAGVLEFD